MNSENLQPSREESEVVEIESESLVVEEEIQILADSQSSARNCREVVYTNGCPTRQHRNRPCTHLVCD